MSPRVGAAQAAALGAMHSALRIAATTGRTTGPEFDRVSTLMRERDDIILDESELTPECLGQLSGGN